MKRVLLTLFVMLFMFVGTLCAGDVNEPSGDVLNGWTAWFLGDYKQSGARVGHEVGESVEIGLQTYVYTQAIPDLDPPDVYGIYGIYDFPGEIDLSKIPLIRGLEDQIEAASYVGYQISVELDDDNKVEEGYHGPLVGLVLTKFFFDEVDDQIQTGTEFQYITYTDRLEDALGTDDEWRLLFFFRILF